MPKKYAHKEWPKMVFHPGTGVPFVCASLKDIPEGYVDHISQVGVSVGVQAPEPFRASARKGSRKKKE